MSRPHFFFWRCPTGIISLEMFFNDFAVCASELRKWEWIHFQDILGLLNLVVALRLSLSFFIHHIAFARHVWPASTFGVKWRSWMVTWMIEWWNINTIPCWSISDDFFWGNWGEQKTATYKPIFTSERAAGWQRDVFLNGADQRSARIFRKVTRTYLYQESFLRGKSFSNCQYFRRYVFWECKCLGNFVGNSSKFI